MTKEAFKERIASACHTVIAAESELTEIDARFGDADHGITMTKICKAILAASEASDGNIRENLDDIAMAVMTLNGGSAVPLWNTWLDGMQEGAPEADEADISEIKAIFARGFEEIDDMSGAKVGDKTMMDALIPASEAIAAYEGDDEAALFASAAAAAGAGAEKTKDYTAKFGRAKSYGQKTIGTPDCGALSMAYFFAGLAK